MSMEERQDMRKSPSIRVLCALAVIAITLIAGGRVALPVGAAPAHTNVCQAITGSVTWDITGSPYVLTCTITVTVTGTLNISPGVTVQGGPNNGIQVAGR